MSLAFERPTNISHALEILSRGEYAILSGGTDYFPALGEQSNQKNIVDISAVDELHRLEFDKDHWRIGALTTWSQLIATKLPPAFDGLIQAAREIGSIQIQNRATIVGNICNASPAADGVPPLLTLNARVEIMSANCLREMSLHDFIVGNRITRLEKNEMVSAILIPQDAAKGNGIFVKLGARKYLVISIAMVAARLSCDENKKINDLAVSVGACSLVAQRLKRLETELIGKPVNSLCSWQAKDRHIQHLSPIDDIRASRHYRLQAVSEITTRAITLLAKGCQ